MNIDLDSLQKLPVADKLHIVAQLWDDISNSDEPLILRDWHEDEARQRTADLKSNPKLAITRDELWRQVDKSDG